MNAQQIRTAVDKTGLTQKEVAKEIGLSYGHLRNVLSGSQTLGRAPGMLLKALVQRTEV